MTCFSTLLFICLFQLTLPLPDFLCDCFETEKQILWYFCMKKVESNYLPLKHRPALVIRTEWEGSNPRTLLQLGWEQWYSFCLTLYLRKSVFGGVSCHVKFRYPEAAMMHRTSRQPHCSHHQLFESSQLTYHVYEGKNLQNDPSHRCHLLVTTGDSKPPSWATPKFLNHRNRKDNM